MKSITIDERLDKIDSQIDNLAKTITKGFAGVDKRFANVDKVIERISFTMINGFAETDKKIEESEAKLKGQIDVYARAVDAYAKQAETYMQEMLALGAKVDRLEKQIQQIATHLNLQLMS